MEKRNIQKSPAKGFSQVFWRACLALVVSAAVLGSLFSVPRLSVLGVVPTYFRAVMLLLTLVYLIRRAARRAPARLPGMFFAAGAALLFWMLYAGAQLLLIPGLNLREGLKDIAALVLGLMCVYCFCEANADARDFRFVVSVVRVLGTALILFALFEITTGIHLPTSRFCDEAFLKSQWYVSRYGSGHVVWHTATGPYYNQNDFALVLALLSPFFFPHKNSSGAVTALCYAGLVMIFAILAMCGSFIVTIAMIAGTGAFLIITRASLVKHAGVWTTAALIQIFISKQLYALLIRLYGLLSGLLSGMRGGEAAYEAVDQTQTLGDALTDQVGNLLVRKGSLYYRLTIYVDGTKAFLRSRGLGLGPGGFQHYFTVNPSASGLVNPHNWWLEVLAQFGLPVFAAYAALYIAVFVKTLILYRKTRFRGFACVLAMLVVFAIGCIAPSSLIRVPYKWLPLALGVSMLRRDYAFPPDTQAPIRDMPL